MTIEVVLMGREEALKFTADIKRRIARTSGDIEAIKGQLVEAERREVWRAAGYRSMAAYVVGALGMARSNAYRTLDVARAQLLPAVETVPRGTESDQLPKPSQREAERIMAPLKQKRARRGPPSLTSWLEDFRNDIERLQGALDMADGDPFEHLDAVARRDLERTADKCFTFWGELIDKLAAPAAVRETDEWGAA